MAWFRGDCAGEFSDGRELPNPAGGRPRSLVFPCASQVRVLLPRCDGLLPEAPADVRFEFVIAEGGRLFASSCWRAVMPDVPVALADRLFIEGALPGRLFIAGALCDDALGATARWFMVLFAGPLPVRPAVKAALLTVRTCICDGPRAGAVRATTGRL